MRRVILLGAVLTVALLGAAPAQAKPVVFPGTLTLKFKWEPLPPLVRPMWGGGEGPIKTNGRGLWQAKPVVFAETAFSGGCRREKRASDVPGSKAVR